jgi:hypothetical protein
MTMRVDVSPLQGDKYLKYEGSTEGIIGKRVRFKWTNNPSSNLCFNDLGTVVGVTNLSTLTGRQMKLWIRWDKGGNYSLTDGFDSFDIFAEPVI